MHRQQGAGDLFSIKPGWLFLRDAILLMSGSVGIPLENDFEHGNIFLEL